MCSLQTGSETSSTGAGDEVAVGVMPMWQSDNVGADGGALQPLRELLCSFLPGLILVLVESMKTERPG